jgi:hypothetical protein
LFSKSAAVQNNVVQVFSTDGPDQSFHERMRQRNVRRLFDFLDLQDPQIGLPLMEPIQGIIVRTQIVRQCLRVNRAIEHAAQCHAIHNAAVNGEANMEARPVATTLLMLNVRWRSLPIERQNLHLPLNGN